MDNPEEVYYNNLENQYLTENAKFKVGDVVYFEDTNDKNRQMCVGIIIAYHIKTYIRNTSDNEYRFAGIVYDIVTPIKLAICIAECKITSASEFIYREYIYNNAE